MNPVETSKKTSKFFCAFGCGGELDMRGEVAEHSPQGVVVPGFSTHVSYPCTNPSCGKRSWFPMPKLKAVA